MKKIILLIVGCILCSNLKAQNLNSHQWVNRVVIIKTNDEQSIKYQKQLEEFSSSKEDFKDRKLVAYQIIGSTYQYVNYENETEEKLKIESLTKKVLKEKHDFEVILIGLDGSIKLRKTEPLSKEALFRKIDSMPLRKAELKNRN